VRNSFRTMALHFAFIALCFLPLSARAERESGPAPVTQSERARAVGDCNGNSVPDGDDIAGNTSNDCNGNQFPDECEPDCNGNSVADTCDIIAATSVDSDGNLVPDECEPRCFSGTPDIQIYVDAWTDEPTGLQYVVQGNLVRYQIGFALDPGTAGGNRGLATLGYTVFSDQARQAGRFLEPLADAFSGFDDWGLPRTISDLYITFGSGSGICGYGGGWGFSNAGLDGGGDPSVAGQLRFAGASAPLTWSGNTGCALECSRLDVGIGAYSFPADDPILGGLQGGFGLDLSNLNSIIEGDGTWIIQEGVIDTTDWPTQTYNFTVLPDNFSTHSFLSAVYDGTLDYTTSVLGGFRVDVPNENICGAGFSFNLFPFDCNENQFPDLDDITQGTSQDCNTNLIPDECDIAAGTSIDSDSNQVPDECEGICSFTCGDINSDGAVNLNDFSSFAVCFGREPAVSQACVCSDINADGFVSLIDFATFALIFGAPSTNSPPNCP